MVRDVEIDGNAVSVTIALTVAGCPLRSSFQDQVAEHVGSLPNVERVELRFDVMSPDEKAALTTKLRGGRPEKSISLDPRTRVIAVASGKGGVGKSSLTVNLAAALDGLGQQVGLIDADVYGHSLPHMLGVHQRPIVVDKMIVPPVRGRMKFISIGSFMDDNAPVMWRGPMLHRALEQFLSDVHWGELDTVLIDMPPGTGDMAISLGQLLPRAEVLVVTTPQPLAQEVAVRAAVMAQKTGQKLLGVVENMTGEMFGSGGGAKLADELGVPLLGIVPLDAALRAAGDLGVPVVEADPESDSARAIVAIAESLAASRQAAIRKPLTFSPRTTKGARRRPSQLARSRRSSGARGPSRASNARRAGRRSSRPCRRSRSCSASRSPIVQVCEALPSVGLDRDRGRGDRLDRAAHASGARSGGRLGLLAVGTLREHRSVRAGAGAELAVGQPAGLAERAGEAAEDRPVAVTGAAAQPAVELAVGVDGREARAASGRRPRRSSACRRPSRASSSCCRRC